MTQMLSMQQTPESGSRLVLVAAVLGVAAVILVNAYVQYVRSTAQTGELTVYRLVMSVGAGEELTEEMVQEIRVPETLRQSFENYVDSPAQLEAKFGDQFTRDVRKYEILTTTMFTGGSDEAIDMEFATGQVVKAVQVNAQKVPRALRPGMWVNLLAPIPRRSSGKIDIIPVMERVKIQLVGAVTTLDEMREGAGQSKIGNYSTIGVVVTPEQGRRLEVISRFVASYGQFDVQIRNRRDMSEHFTDVDWADGINQDVWNIVQASGIPADSRGTFRR